MSHRISAGLVWFSLVSAIGISAVAAGPEDKLPASASLVVLLDKPNEAAAKWQKTAVGSMLVGKDFSPFYTELQKNEIAAPLNPKPALGLDWADIAKFKQPASLSIMEGDVKTPALVFLASGKEDAAEIKRVMVEAEKYFDRRQAKREVKKADKAEMVAYSYAKVGFKEGGVCIHLTSGDLFAATNSSAAADKLLKQWEAGEKGSLAADSDFKKVDVQSRKMAGDKGADVRWFVRPLELAALLQTKEKRARGEKDWVTVAGKQGVSAVVGIGGILNLQADKNHDLEVASLIVAKRPFERGMRMFDLKPGKPILPASWVEAEVGSYLSWNMDFAAAFEGAGIWVDEKMNDKGFFAAYLGDLKIAKQVDLKQDIVDRLGPGMFQVNDTHRTKDPSNPTGARRIIGITSKEQAKLAKALSLVSRNDPMVIRDETIAGNPVRSAPEGEPLFVEPEDGAPKNTKAIQAYAVMPSLSLLSSDATWLRSKLAPKERVKPLTDDGAYKQVTAWTAALENDQTCLRGFIRNDQSRQADYETVRTGAVVAKSSLRTKFLRYLLLGDSSAAAAKSSAAALPGFDALAPNLLPSGVSMAVSPDGFELRATVLRKE